MDFYGHNLIENGLIIANVTEVEAFFLPLLFENEKRSAGSEIIDTKYDSGLTQLVVVFNDYRAVLNIMKNYQKIEYKGQEYVPYRINRRQMIIKLVNPTDNFEYAIMLAENIFQDFMKISSIDVNMISDRLLLVTTEKDIDFRVVFKRGDKLHSKAKFSVHLIADTAKENYDKIYSKKRASTAESLLMQSDETLNFNSMPQLGAQSNSDFYNENNSKNVLKNDIGCQAEDRSTLTTCIQTENPTLTDTSCQTDNKTENTPATATSIDNATQDHETRQDATQSVINTEPIEIEFTENNNRRRASLISLSSTDSDDYHEATASNAQMNSSPTTENELQNSDDEPPNRSLNPIQSVINNEETVTEHHANHRTNDYDARNLNIILSRKIDELEERMNQYDKKLKELSKPQQASNLQEQREEDDTPSVSNRLNRTDFTRFLDLARSAQTRSSTIVDSEPTEQNNNEDETNQVGKQAERLRSMLRTNPPNSQDSENAQNAYSRYHRRLDEQRRNLVNRTAAANSGYRRPQSTTTILPSSVSPTSFDYNEIFTNSRPRFHVPGRNVLSRESLSSDQINRFPTSKYNLKNTGKEDICPICLEEYKQNDLMRILTCFDKFHTKCIDTWLSTHKSCPCCKHDLLTDLNDQHEN